MKQEDIGPSLAASADLFGGALTMCDVAAVVYKFLSKLLDKGSWWERAVIRIVLGYVGAWQRENGCLR